MKEPFFIVGCGRSGTTLLKSILSAHPDLFPMPETFFFRSILPRVAHHEKAPWKAIDSWWMADMGVTPRSIKPFVERRLDEGRSTECALLVAVFDFHSAKNPGKAIGEKTPNHINHLGAIRTCFPDAPVIQIVRDPRAVLASFRKVKVGSNAVSDIVNEWSSAIDVLNHWCGTEGFLSIRYEDLVENPEGTLKQVCQTLGVRWSSEVLEFHRRRETGFAPEQAHHANTLRALFRGSLESWRNEISGTDVALVEWALRDEMLNHGYAPDGDEVRAPNLRMALSRTSGQVHRFLVRVPRQLLKALKARRRQARDLSKQ
ncbi:sulfotransferase [Burkholderiaceae bacterium]|nr:sulfotransferase [Burkholderiaceae bacterium]